MNEANNFPSRIVEEEIESAIDSRNEALASLRELGPPDLVHLVKQSIKSGGRQVRMHKDENYTRSFVDRGCRLECITMLLGSTLLHQPVLLHM